MDAVKVGIGAGSICTTRVVAGIGVPLITAIADCARRRGAAQGADHRRRRHPLLRRHHQGDRRRRERRMIGSLFAGTDESPGELILFQGRSFKEYRGMGSLGAMRRGSRDRYFQDEFDLEAQSRGRREARAGRHRGPRRPQGLGGRDGPPADGRPPRRHGLHAAAATSPTLQRDAQMIRVSPAGLREGHVHDVIITKEAPNYRVE